MREVLRATARRHLPEYLPRGSVLRGRTCCGRVLAPNVTFAVTLQQVEPRLQVGELLLRIHRRGEPHCSNGLPGCGDEIMQIVSGRKTRV